MKVTLKETVNESEVGVIPSGFTLQPKKTIVYRDAAPPSAAKKDNQVAVGPVIPINCVTFNQNEKYIDQFAMVDDQGCLSLWDVKKGLKVVEEPKVTNGLLMTCSIEAREGKLVACGGIDTKLHVFSINPSGKKKEKLTLIEKVKELTGHYGLITCCSFMS